MADTSASPDSDHGKTGPERRSPAGTPLWVKVFGLIALVAVVLFVVLMLVGGGEHGPGRHTLGPGPHGSQQP